MDKMIGYIFGSLSKSEASIVNIKKALKAQRGVNFRLMAGVAVATASIAIVNQHVKMLNEKIEALKTEVEELKNEKGE